MSFNLHKDTPNYHPLLDPAEHNPLERINLYKFHGFADRKDFWKRLTTKQKKNTLGLGLSVILEHINFLHAKDICILFHKT